MPNRLHQTSRPVPALRLESALQLLRQSGHTLPEADDPAWLQAVVDALCELSSRDALTGLANRRQFEIALAREIDRVARGGEPALLLMIDIDHFKQVNDAHGHAAGDRVLQAIAARLLDCVRPMDTLARIGGEEFAIILPNYPPAFGRAVAERIRQKVERQTIEIDGGPPVTVTISLGGAFAPQWVRSNAAQWLARADEQLYRAKEAGRNRSCLESMPDVQASADEKRMRFSRTVPDDLDDHDRS
jgi:diguanylate cyclase (GGDEF)-like protein